MVEKKGLFCFITYNFCFMQTHQVLQRHMNAVAVYFAKAIASVILNTLTTSVPVTGTAMKRPVNSRPLRQISGSMWVFKKKKSKINQNHCVLLIGTEMYTNVTGKST